ncbi:leucine-rich repeat domain-containing protein [Clostridium estertheticum]|uniref:Bacterial Ig-like domain-containing protein n=1 Tax=Clostridium estertheticum TaxID=238834 RepID=A0A7Y3SX08_9CLOT|nr:Ig-like domain-containing protein [Clostridium estertheticum]NNU76548.1 hypothetical protein [Clostridium estertheticum]WBL49690.1 Ig-like domain-containing protein [Clostridium estertheticum]
MRKKVINSFLAALIIAGASSISAFATTDNGSVVIGTKSFDLAYANDTKNSTEITNAIVEGGEIYVKDFSGSWIDNKTGLTVNERIVPGEDGSQVSTLVVESVTAINDTKKVGDVYKLPTTITATLSDGTTKELSVTWDKVASTTVAGNYIFKGTLTMVDGVINSSNVIVSATLNITNSNVISDTDITSKFTDDNFKRYVYSLIGKSYWDDPILYSDVKNIKKIDLCSDLFDSNESSLNGIEYFTELTYLDCTKKSIKTLDLSKNTALTMLRCSYSNLTTLDLSKNIKLTDLDCSYTKLKTLDLSKNTALSWLDCSQNQLTTLDLSKNIKLSLLNCYDNKLKALDLSKNIKLYWLACNMNNIKTLDLRKNTALTMLDCAGNELTSLIATKNIDSSNYSIQYINSTHTTAIYNFVITIIK